MADRDLRPDEAERLSTDAIGRAVTLLELVSAAREPVPLSVLVRHSGIPKSTAHRLMLVLVENHLVERIGQNYRPGSRAYALVGLMAGEGFLGLRHLAMPYLVELHRRTRQTASLAVVDRLSVHVLESVYEHGNLRLNRQGYRFPLHCTAAGKLFLAYQPDLLDRLLEQVPLRPCTERSIVDPERLRAELVQVRRYASASANGEHHLDAIELAMPVIGRDTRPAAAIVVSGRIGELDIDAVEAALRPISIAASLALRRHIAHQRS